MVRNRPPHCALRVPMAVGVCYVPRWLMLPEEEALGMKSANLGIREKRGAARRRVGLKLSTVLGGVEWVGSIL